MGIVYLDVGHRGDHSPNLGGVAAGYTEGRLNLIYAAVAQWRLIELGHEVFMPVATSSYEQRAAQAIELAKQNPAAKVANIQCHINNSGGSGPNDYSLQCFHYLRPNDRLLGEAIATEFLYSPIRRALNRMATLGEWPGPHYCLRGFDKAPDNLSAIITEPCFICNEHHRAQMLNTEGLRRIGLALADGIDHWLLS